MKTIFTVCVVVSALGLTTQLAAETARLTVNKQNIKVWTIQNPQSPILSYRAETTLDTTLERAVAVVLDVDNAKSWVPNVASTEILSQDLNSGDFQLYMVLDFPFPLKDRDLIVQGKMYKDAKGLIHIKNKAGSAGKVKQQHLVRIQNYVGDWVFEALSPNKVKVTTTGYADPEGAIPQSVTNLFVQQQPYQMLKKMQLEVKKPRAAAFKLPEILK